MKPALVAVLGDEQYQNGYYSDFENSFDKYWGAFKFLQRPAPGNHEFYDNHGQTGVRGLGYFDYYNGLQHNADGLGDRPDGHQPDHACGRLAAGAAAGRPGRPVRPDRQRLVLVQPRQLASDLAEHRVRRRAGRVHPDRVVVRKRDQVAGAGPQRGSQPVHARLLAPADVQLDLRARTDLATAPRDRRPTPGGSCCTPTTRR